ncbi:hypothetical protein INT82_14460 [Mannheimia haemolytica]|nr:hypothetical protein [Mannheimia haemolytica]
MVQVHSDPPLKKASESEATMSEESGKMKWGYSSSWESAALHAGGQRFDPLILHQSIVTLSSYLRLQAVKNTGLFAILGMMIGCSLSLFFNNMETS